jgi:ubiquinone/menaquinone biosynthesis C-methylase UbiE
VNIDLEINREAPNFVKCDAQHLAFRKKIFKKTIVFTVIEHLNKPYEGLREIFRVTDGEVTIKYDCFFSIYNFIGIGHKSMMIRERFVRLPSFFFVFLNRLFTFRPVKYLARKGRLFEERTYEKTYRTT